LPIITIETRRFPVTRFPFLHGRQFLSVACLIFLMLSFNPAKASQTDIAGPVNSGAFGTTVTLLPNGNIVVTDPTFGATDVGAVYLYSGATLALISTLTGSTANDQVGFDGITVLTNGNYVVRSHFWDNPTGPAADAGAVTWCSAATGCSGTVSSGNSLIGGTLNDLVGQDSVTALTNGNYVVRSQLWNNPTGPVADAGAATWVNGATGLPVGLVAPGNSLIGGTAFNLVGNAPVTALTNGNYVVGSALWDKPAPGPITNAGAVTWCDGTTFTSAVVASGNSLIGGTMNDNVGSGGATALTNGNYVVRSTSWDNTSPAAADAGAVTWGNGLGGTVGPVNSGNSLVGGTLNDFVGGGGVIALTNGNYVVGSNAWNKPAPGAVTVAGAVTWGNGTGPGTVGLITSGNSLIGGTASDQVGGSGITALTNGNYVVAGGNWDKPAPGAIVNAGAATWGNGSSGTTGAVDSTNSLIGGTASDSVGSNGVTALTNGNYVVKSPSWNSVGAATWCNGTTLTSSVVSSGNSLIGGTAGDGVGSVVVALTNGNYVVSSQNWDKPAPGPIVDVGAVTWCNGTTFTSSLVSSGNSLVGGTASDSVGNSNVFALTNGNYVVSSTSWDNPALGASNNAGAATWGNGLGGTVGAVSSANSLVGGTLNDNVGFGGVRALTNGNYAVQSNSWDNGGTTDAGAATFGNGTIGTAGLITSANSVLGTVMGGGISTFSFDATRNRVFVGRSLSNIVSVLFFQTTATANGNIDSAGTWGSGVPTALTNVIIPSPFAVTVNTASTIGSLNLASGATLTMSANLNVTGGLTLGTQIDTGANTLALSCSTTVSGASSSIFITGNLKRDFCATGSGFSYPTSVSGFSGGGAATGAFTYPVGTTFNGNEFSPLAVTVTALGNNLPGETSVPSSLTVKANYGTIAPLADLTTLDRYWTLTESGDLTANLVFNYLQTDVDGAESGYRIIRVSGGIAVMFPNACPAAPCVDTVANTATINNVPTFSDWTLGEAQPTAAKATVSGQIIDTNGIPVEGAVVRLAGTQNRKFITDANGFYRFDNVETGGFYTVTPSRANYSFNPSVRSFSQIGETTEAAFGATLASSTFVNPLDTTEYFVRQHYLDFLGREPDEAGFNFWSDQILACGADAGCIERRTINVSAAYFLSIEFQQTGGLVDGLYRASYGRAPRYAEFMPDTRVVAHDVIVGRGDWAQQLEANKQAFVDAWVERPAFHAAYDGLANASFVDTLISHTGAGFDGDRDALVRGLNNGSLPRAAVLRQVVENEGFTRAKSNEMFVMMEYFGYLCRDPDDSGYHFWLNKLNEFGGNFEQAEMVKAFIVSGEYRARFQR
jgi:uncharacterized protein DUF5650/carboxypeptidase family protein/uncharacterized protein DUF4214